MNINGTPVLKICGLISSNELEFVNSRDVHNLRYTVTLQRHQLKCNISININNFVTSMIDWHIILLFTSNFVA